MLRALVLGALLIPLAGAFVMVGALAAGGWWLERVYLRDEIRVGEDGALRAHGLRFDWIRLNVVADSLLFRSPALDARVDGVSVGIDWVNGLLALRPAARLDVDTLRVFTRGDTTTKAPTPLDSLTFPEFTLPLAVSARVRTLVVEDSAGTLLRLRDAFAGSRGGTRARARIGRITTRWSGTLALRADASVNWSARDSVDYGLTIRRVEDARKGRPASSSDEAAISGRHAKAPLWRGRDSLKVAIADLAPYRRELDAEAPSAATRDDDVPGARDVRLGASVTLGDSLKATLRAGASLDAWRSNPDFTLSAQTVALSADWINDRGALTLTSTGREGEDVRLAFTTRLLRTQGRDATSPATPSAVPGLGLDSTRPLWEQARATLTGHARGLRVRVRDTLRTADAAIRRATWDGRALELSLATGDSSRVEARADLAGPRRSWRGTFRATIGPEERWVKVFAGDAITFGALSTEGSYEGRTETVKATVAARAVTAYGTSLDSLRTHHEYDLARGRCTLKPSRLYGSARGGEDKRTRRDATAWTLAGTVTIAPGKRGVAVDATLAGDGLGSLRYTLAPDGTMEAAAHDFEATALPHEALDSLPVRDGLLGGTFRWNPARREGRADLTARVRYLNANGRTGANPGSGAGARSEPVDARLEATWTRDLFTLGNARVSYRGSDLTARARLRPQGKQFYELAKVPAAQYDYAAVEAERFDLADILKAFLPEPPLDSGVVRGALSFNGPAGFAGNLALERLGLKDAPGGLMIPLLRVEGRGDTLRALARTSAPDAPWFNDSVHAELTGARGDNQRVLVRAVMNDSLNLRAEATMHRFSNLAGQLRVNGLLALPSGGGALRDIKGLLTFDIPSFTTVMERGTLTTQVLSGTYVLPGQPRQRLTADPVLRGGVLVIPGLRIENEAGQTLTGRMEYAPAKGTLTADVEGARFSARWTDDYSLDVNDLAITLSQGPQGTRLRGSLGSGSFTFADLPLRVQGRLGNVRVAFTRPPRPAGSARQSWQPDTLRVSGVLQESELRYRLRNLGDIQRVLSGGGPKRPTAGTPLVLDVKMRTAGNANRINTDMARMSWVGDLAVRGVHPYTLLEGRVNATAGEFGLEREAYTVRRLDMKWLNAPVEEGEIHMEARKELASACTPAAQGGAADSCTVIARLDGSLADLQFSYDSDCGGAYGAGANVAAILYSVQRGCYDASIGSGEGRGYGERALTLLEPTISRSLTQLMGPFWGSWVETADVSGLGSLSPDEANGDSVGEALSLALTSREYRRFRIKVRSGYHLNSQDLSSPMENMLALEWRIPLPRALRDSLWRERLNNNLRAAASVETRPVRRGSLEEDEIERKIGLFYNYAWWGEWWARKEEGLE